MTAVEDKGYFYSGDPLIREWFLVKTNYWPFILCASYVFFVKRLGPHLMKNRKPFDLRRLMVVYNFIVVAVYSTCLYKLAYIYFTTEASKTLCNPTKILKNHYTSTACSTVWVIYLLKYIEFADTIFFVLRKKYHLVTNLHVIHHGILPLLFWSGMRTETRGFRVILIYINSTVHAIMYTYYGLAAIGPQVQKYLWWKEHLTRLQMTQFVLLLILALFANRMHGCTTTPYAVHVDFLFTALILVLFYNFYIKNYTKDKKEANVKENTKDTQFAVIIILGIFGSTLSGCTSSNRHLYSDMFFALLFLVLFYNFYTRTYSKKKTKTQPGDKNISKTDSNFISEWLGSIDFFIHLRKDHV